MLDMLLIVHLERAYQSFQFAFLVEAICEEALAISHSKALLCTLIQATFGAEG